MNENKHIISNYVACFIDVLGQSEALLRYPLMPENLDDTFKKWLKETFGCIKMLRSSFFDYFSSFNAYEPRHPKYKEYKNQKIKIHSISDSVLIYSTLFEEEDYLPILDIHDIVCATALIQLLFLSIGKPFRASIDIGIGLETEELGFYGSILPKVVNLEKNAVFPITLIGRDLFEYLKYYSKYQFENNYHFDRNIINNNFAKKTLDELIINFKGKTMIHFLSKYFFDVSKTAGTELKDMGIKAHEFINLSLNQHKGNKKILKKYVFLKDYFDEYISIWIN